MSGCQGSIIVGLLWCVVILSLIVIGVLHTASLDLFVGKNYGDRTQAYYLAVAGIEKAKALLYQNAKSRKANRTNHDGKLFDDPTDFRDIPLSRGHFRLIRRARSDEGGGLAYGVSDEESRLNLNVASREELTKLPGITPELVNSILGWRGEDGGPAAAGEADFYAAQIPPRQARKAAFQTVRELLMVRGITPQLLLGRDRYQNGLLQRGPQRPATDSSIDPIDPTDLGWAGLLTVSSSVDDVNAAGQNRVDLQSADQGTLAAIPGLNAEIAQSIVNYRNKHRFENIIDLLDVPLNPTQSNNGNNPPASADSATKAISEDLFIKITDDVVVGKPEAQKGAININTAGVDVLICLPGIERELAQAIVEKRQAGSYYGTIGELLRVTGMTHDLFKNISAQITTRSETYRILCEGRVNSSGVSQRIQAVIHVGSDEIQTLEWREDNL